MALDLPADAREALVEWRRGLAHPDLRLVAPEALHVTLVFLGYLDEEEIPRIRDLIEPPDVETPVLRATGVKPVPPRQPRLFALDLEDEGGRCGAIQASVSEGLAEAGLYSPEKRPFWPHVTLARVRKGGRVRSLETPAPPAEPWRAHAVTLYRSVLRRKGARYEPLTRFGLG